eukprot:3387463-Prymnesium_polylepis.1
MISLDELVVWRAERRRVGRREECGRVGNVARCMSGRRDGWRAQPSCRSHLWPGWPQYCEPASAAERGA